MKESFRKEILACFIGIIIGAVTAHIILPKSDNHAVTHSDEYHIHADFLIQIHDEVLELGVAELTTTASQTLHEHAHLHDENGDVLHMHKENITFAEFLSSLGFTLADDCLTTLDQTKYCSTESESLSLFVNNKIWDEAITKYVPQDLDRVMLYYGSNPDSAELDKIPDEACIYSGSCPERGTAPPESCGLTCEL